MNKVIAASKNQIGDSLEEINLRWPDFISGVAEQRYLQAEVGAASASQNGYSNFYVDGSLKGERPGDWSMARSREFVARCRDLGVVPEYHGNFKVPLGSDVVELRVAAQEYAAKEIDLCTRIGCKNLILHGGGIVEPRNVKDARAVALEGLIESLRNLAHIASESGVKILLENLCNYGSPKHPFYYIGTTSKEYRDVLECVPEVDLIFDVSHEHVNGGDTLGVFAEFSSRIAALAMSDNKGVVDSHLPLGAGDIDYKSLVKEIRAKGWVGLVSFETRGGSLSQNIEFLNNLA